MILAPRCAAAALAMAAATPLAHAGTLTTINPPVNPFAEPSLAEMLTTVTGSPVDLVGPLRVHDDLDHTFAASSSFRLTFIGSYWGLGSLMHDVSVFADGALVATGADAAGSLTGPAALRIDAYNPDSDVTASTDPAFNLGGHPNGPLDRVVTFDVSAFDSLDDALGNPVDLTPGADRYLLFVEAGSDRDYQDFVLLLETDGGPVAVPTPSAVAAGLLLGAFTTLRRRR